MRLSDFSHHLLQEIEGYLDAHHMISGVNRAQRAQAAQALIDRFPPQVPYDHGYLMRLREVAATPRRPA